MARPTNEERLHRKLEFFRADFDRIQMAQRDERLLCLMDRRFATIAGAQYEGPLLEMYANKPRFEFNRVALAVQRVENEYRNNRVTVDFQPRDGSENDELADACDGLYRADEQASGAKEAYDNAFREGISGGVGGWRLRACLDDEDDYDEDRPQRVKIEPIFDADSCMFFDLDAKRADKRDATRCYVLSPWTYEAYIDEWGDDPASWDKVVTQAEFDWCTPNLVWVAEVYEVEEVKEPVQYWRNVLLPDEPERKVTKRDLEDQPELPQVLAATGYELSREMRRVERKVVHKYLMSGSKILEDCGIIAGSCIPIIPFFGRREVIDGIERCGGVVRLARDAQMLVNMLMSWLAEMASRFDIEKPIVTPEQMGQWATMWSQDAVEKNPYLVLNAVLDPATGQQIMPGNLPYTKAPSIPPAMAALTELATQALSDLLGNAQAGEQLQPNLSGKAVELIQNRLDMQVFIYMSNFATYAMKRSGEVWLSMMKDIARQDSRRMKTISSDGQAGSVVLNQPKIDETGKEIVALDMSAASYDVVVDVGPSSGSQRAATVRALTGMASVTQDPETQKALTLATMLNLEGEGLAELRDWARKQALRLGIVKPTEAEKQELAAEQQNQQPDPQAAFLLAEAQKAAAQTGLAVANTEKARAQSAETLAGIDTARQQQAIEAVRTIAEIQRTDAQLP